jgi:hypothetical protein
MKPFRLLTTFLLISLSCLLFVPDALAFCGFYVAKADASLYNQASQVAIVRSGNRTVMTMANDYQGEVKDFAIVVPVPVVLRPEQVQVSDPKIIERLDAFSAPRLVEYFDADPCAPMLDESLRTFSAPQAAADNRAKQQNSSQALGVTVEAKFTVGEYNILMLSARESSGLATWLLSNGYRIPQSARSLLQPYIRQRMKFFVAKVNLEAYEATGYQSLRPLQISYESPRFMLPIRLGMVNAQTAQDLVVYILSPEGQAEVTNYRTVKMPGNATIPLYVKDKFSEFYKATFQTAYNREGKNVAFLEYAWDMAGCDPCSAEPLTSEELRQAGVFWLTSETPTNVFLTRLHVRYTRDRFPEDLMFQQTSSREFFQGRYILRHPFTGQPTCANGQQYQRSLPQRFEQEAQTLARLTGWNIQEIRQKLPQVQTRFLPWWRRLWLALFGE